MRIRSMVKVRMNRNSKGEKIRKVWRRRGGVMDWVVEMEEEEEEEGIMMMVMMMKNNNNNNNTKILRRW